MERISSSKRWKKDDEEKLREIIKRERANKKEEDRMDWKYISKEFGNSREIKSLQEKYRNFLKKEVWLPYGNGKRQIPFTSKHVTLIMNETWKNVDNKNRWRRIANIINKQFPLQVDCTPNQVKNKYNTTFRKLRT
ncbi:8461_t:CDS:2 [Acaulospora morrowiae]|uniref:8461_t:CDS:1 n=1 Tax=Acaulospora morrowiae TaxID=94023 RepID=A0A9N8WHI7_9GLOM|nr:8461_t:CDS:2 [Acaulospora morrowiae]